MTNERDVLRESAILGNEVDLFIKSDIGQYMLARADERRNISVESLKTVFPWRQRRIRELQNEVWKCESFELWLRDAYQDGQFAMDELEERK